MLGAFDDARMNAPAVGHLRQNRRMNIAHRCRALAAATALSLLCAAAHAARPGPGDVPPADVGRGVGGDPVVLGAYAGKAVIVTFWATWCPYCLKELPVLENVQNQAGKDRMRVIAVNTESRDVFRKAARIMGEAMHLELANDADGRAQEAFGVRGIPHMVIIGRDGRILRVYSGYSESKLDEIVADINLALAPLH